jgi:hypothetical protein
VATATSHKAAAKVRPAARVARSTRAAR